MNPVTQHFVLPDTAAALPHFSEITAEALRGWGPVEGRKVFRESLAENERPVPPLTQILDFEAPGPAGLLEARLYDPRPYPVDAGPVVVYLHGGGWVAGDVDAYHGMCAEMAAQLGCRVTAVNYRLAPEHPYPAAFEDCMGFVEWVAQSPSVLGGRVTGVVVAGDSSGGNLAAATTIALRNDTQVTQIAQFLIYPVTDCVGAYESDKLFERGYLLEQPMMDYFHECYLPNVADRSDWRASVILAPDLSRLPPTVFVVCGLDPLRDQCRAYAARIVEGGNTLVYHEFPGQIHCSFQMRAAIPSAHVQLSRALADLKRIIVP